MISCLSNPKSNTTRKWPELEIMIVKYSPVMFDEKPNRKPCGLVVVKPTRMLSAIVERHDPRKSYLTDELDRRLTPISVQIRMEKCGEHFVILSTYRQSAVRVRGVTNHQHKLAP